jgi:hypothetical protein
MNIFDLITQDELDDLPEDSSLAFLNFVRHAQRRLGEKLSSIDESEQYGWQEANTSRLGFMNVVVAAAKRFEISPFAEMEVPPVANSNDATHIQFKFDLDHYLTQLAIDNTIRQRSDSVQLSEKARDRVRQHVAALKECVLNSNLTESKKSNLAQYLTDFEKELDRKRISLLKVTWVGLQMLAIPGSLWASSEVVTKLVSNINQTVAEEKVAEEERPKLPQNEAPKALIAPRRVATVPSSAASGFGGGNFSDDLDDDVPF